MAWRQGSWRRRSWRRLWIVVLPIVGWVHLSLSVEGPGTSSGGLGTGALAWFSVVLAVTIAGVCGWVSSRGAEGPESAPPEGALDDSLSAADGPSVANSSASETMFSQAFRATPDAIVIAVVESGEILEVNEGFVKTTGYSPEDVIGRTTLEVEFFEVPEERRRLYERLLADGRVERQKMEFRMRGGECRSCVLSAEVFTLEGRLCAVSVVHDISGQTRAEEALRTSEANFATAFRSSPDAIIIASIPEGVILEANQGFGRITGYSRQEAVGQKTLDLQLWAFEDQRMVFLETIREHGQVRDFEADFIDRDGGVRICLMSAEQVTVEGQDCLLAVVRDVTERRQAEQALRLSEARFANAFRASPDAIMITELHRGQLLEVNESFSAMTGISRQEALGKTIHELGLWRDADDHQAMMQELLEKRRIRNFETHFYSVEGDHLPCIAAMEIIEVEGDEAVLLVVRDVTELRHAEASKQRLYRMLEAVSDFVAIADLEGKLIYLNRGGRRMIGVGEDEPIEALSLADFHLPEERLWLRQQLLPELSQVEEWSGETVMVSRTGQRIPALQVLTYHGSLNPDDEAFLSTIAHDITDRKRMEEALVSSEERFSKAFHASPDGILLASVPLGQILEANQGFSRLTGYSRGEAIGRTTSQLNIWQEPQDRHRLMDRMSHSGQVKEHEIEVRDLHGKPRACMVSGEMIHLGSKPCTLLIFRDVTEKRRTEQERDSFVEELEAKNAELERFTYTVSHDLKSPLVTIQGFLGLLRRDLEANAVERASRDIDRIQNAAATMGRLLDELLELSRVGRVVNPSERVDLGALVREVADLLAGITIGRRVQLIIADDLPNVFGDRPRLREVLQNLLDNALKFLGEADSPTVEVGWRRDDDESVFFVRDNGAGIDPQYHQKVFGLFDRLDPSIEGTGIGLALVKRIIEYHEGRVWVESEGLGHGSTFCWTLGDDGSDDGSNDEVGSGD